MSTPSKLANVKKSSARTQIVKKQSAYDQMRSNVLQKTQHRTNRVGQAADAMLASPAAFWAIPVAERGVVTRLSILHDMLATKAQRVAKTSGFFSAAQQVDAADLPANVLLVTTTTDQGFIFPGCLAMIGSVSALVQATSDSFAVNVALVDVTDIEEGTFGMPAFDGTLDATGIPAGADPEVSPARAALKAVYWHGRPAQISVQKFLTSHDLVISQCGVLIERIPLCDIARFNCGVQFQGASSSLEPPDEAVAKASERIRDHLGIERVMVLQNTDGGDPIPPVTVPTTYGNPKQECPGYYDFKRPLVTPANFPLSITVEVSESCPGDAEDFAESMENGVDDEGVHPTNTSDGVFEDEVAGIGAQGATVIIKGGEWCITLEFHGCQLTQEGWEQCWNRYFRNHPEKVCDACFGSIRNACGDALPERDPHGNIVGQRVPNLLPATHKDAVTRALASGGR